MLLAKSYQKYYDLTFRLFLMMDICGFCTYDFVPTVPNEFL